jgi:hypothetical protein
MKTKLFSVFMILVLLASVAAVAYAAPAADQEPDLAGRVDNRVDPLSAQQAALHSQAMDAKLNGQGLG